RSRRSVDTGAMGHEVEPIHIRTQLGDGPVDLDRSRQVGRYDANFRTEAFEAATEILETVVVAVAQAELHALLGQQRRARSADPARRADDESHFPCEFRHGYLGHRDRAWHEGRS